MVLPDTFPNSEVKRFSGDDSLRATVRENISPPEQYLENLQIVNVIISLLNIRKAVMNSDNNKINF